MENTEPKDKISFMNFLDLIVPKNHIQKNLQKNNGKSQNGNPAEISSLTKILEKEIRLLTLLDKLKAVLLTNTNCDYEGLFSMIDIYERGIIEPDRMLTFLRKHKPGISEEDILSIFRRVNKRADGQISFGEFCSFINYSGMASLKLCNKPGYASRHMVMRKRSESKEKRQSVKGGASSGVRKGGRAKAKMRKSTVVVERKKVVSSQTTGKKKARKSVQRKSSNGGKMERKVPPIDLSSTPNHYKKQRRSYSGYDSRMADSLAKGNIVSEEQEQTSNIRYSQTFKNTSSNVRRESYNMRNSQNYSGKMEAKTSTKKDNRTPLREKHVPYTYTKNYRNHHAIEAAVKKTQNTVSDSMREEINRKLYYGDKIQTGETNFGHNYRASIDSKSKIELKQNRAPLQMVKSAAVFSKNTIPKSSTSKTPLKNGRMSMALSPIKSPETRKVGSRRYSVSHSSSGVTKNDLQIFGEILKKIIVFCNKIEETQRKLYKETDINILHLFRIADEGNKGFLLQEELWELLTSLNIDITLDQLLEFLKYSTKTKYLTKSQKINFSVFMMIFTPISPTTVSLMHDSFVWSESTAKKATISDRSTELIGLLLDLKRKLYKEMQQDTKKISFVARRAVLKEITKSRVADDIEWKDLLIFLKDLGIKFFTDDLIYIFREIGTDGLRIIKEKDFNHFFGVFSE